jgi:ppGpp synthetase/RelA/SpoT-type nucleotidyltranferase
VALFRLGRTLKYKNKPGRTLAQLRSELLTLVDLLEGLADADVPMVVTGEPRWRSLVEAVRSAERKSDLRRAEDQVDAVVCAYVALFAVRRPDLVTAYGDAETGSILTPTLPADHVPSPRRARIPAEPEREGDPVRRAVQTFAAMQPDLRAATDRFLALVTTLLDDAGINYLSVNGRAKSVASFAAKADRTLDGELIYGDPLEQITDQIGIRVITYLHSDVAAVADLLSDQLEVLDDRDMGQETASEGRFGYAGRHLLVAFDGTPGPAQLRHRAQIQVRTVLQHAWAEFEHEIRYKGSIPAEHVPDLDRRFTLAAGLLELADREFTAIRERLRVTISDGNAADGDAADEDASADPRIATPVLATFLGNRYADAGWSRTDHYGWISGLLLELGITSLDELSTVLDTVDADAINRAMGYRYPPGAVRRLDDALLAVFGERYIKLHGNAHRVGLLQERLKRLRNGGG